jgi:hypothetical protein
LLERPRPIANHEVTAPYRPLTQLQDNVFTVNHGDYVSPRQDMSLYNQGLDEGLKLLHAYRGSEMVGTSYDFRGRAEAALDAYVSSCEGCSD